MRTQNMYKKPGLLTRVCNSCKAKKPVVRDFTNLQKQLHYPILTNSYPRQLKQMSLRYNFTKFCEPKKYIKSCPEKFPKPT